MSRKLVFLLATLLMISSVCLAQVEQGAITGAVVDSTGASIPKAKVTATNQATGAATVAAQRLELLKAQPFTSLTVGGDLDSDVTNFNQNDDIPGVGRIHTRWSVVSISGDAQVYFVAVRSEGTGALSGRRSRAEFTTFRSCTNISLGCPTP